MTMAKKWEIIHIPNKLPTPTNEHPTVDVVASEVDPKLANTLIRRLNQIAPLENLHHVKRVKKSYSEGGKAQLSIILCLAANENQLDNVPNEVLDLVNAHQLSPFITKVAEYAASSKEEWQEQCKLWPTSYHPPTYKIDGITGFGEEDSQSIFNFMEMSIKLTKSAYQVVNAAVIVDPSVRQVIASAIDQTCSWHSNMKNNHMETGCTKQEILSSSDENLVAVNDNSAPNKIEKKAKSLTGVSCLYPWAWSERRLDIKNSFSWHPLKHAALVAIENAAARDRQLFPGSMHSQGQANQTGHVSPSSPSSPAKKQKTNISKVENTVTLKACSNGSASEVVRPYLCTGYDIYIVWEPCIMGPYP